MSIHYQKPNYKCVKCEAFFLPFKKGIKCPNCGFIVKDTDSEEYLDVIDKIVSSMKVHKEIHGTYFPEVWLTAGYMDYMQSFIYRIFDQMEKDKPEDERKYFLDLLESMDWSNQEYSKKHVKEITTEVYKIYKTKNFLI